MTSGGGGGGGGIDGGGAGTTTTSSSKVKGSSLDIAPLSILDSDALQTRNWQLIGIGCSTAAQAIGCPEPALTDYWAHSMQPVGILRSNQPR